MSDLPPEDDNLDFDVSSFLGEIQAETHSSETNGNTPDFSMEFSDITIEDVPPALDDSFLDDATNKVGDGECIVCGAPTFRPAGLTKAGRKKRVPRYCDLHSPNVRVSDQEPITSGVESQLRRVQEELADDIRLLGTLAGPLLPVTGYYIFDNADPFTVALLKLAKNNQRVLRVLHRAAQVAPIYTVAQSVAGVAYSVQVDQHKVDPHTAISKRLGVERAYNAVYPDEVLTEEFASKVTTKPPRYSSIT